MDMRMLKQFADMVEELAEPGKLPVTAAFLRDMHYALAAEVGHRYADLICANAQLSFDEYDPSHPDWKRVLKHFPLMVRKAIDLVAGIGMNEAGIDAVVAKTILKIDI